MEAMSGCGVACAGALFGGDFLRLNSGIFGDARRHVAGNGCVGLEGGRGWLCPWTAEEAVVLRRGRRRWAFCMIGVGGGGDDKGTAARVTGCVFTGESLLPEVREGSG